MDFEKVFSLPKCVVPASRALAHTKVKNDPGMYPLGNWLRQIGCHRGTIVGQVFTRCALGWQSSDPSAHPRADPFSRRIEPSDHVRSRPIDSRCAFDSDKSKASPSGYKHLGTFGTCLMPSMTRRY